MIISMLIIKLKLKQMKQLSKNERVQILNDNFFVLNKYLTKQNGEDVFALIRFSGNINAYDLKESIRYSEIKYMNNELEILDYLKK